MASSKHIENSNDLHRLQTEEMEIGATDVARQRQARNVRAAPAVSQRRLDFEHNRPRWLREMLAEMTGVFFYVYPGIASTAGFILNVNNPTPDLQFSSMLQIGFSYMAGIAFAIITCGPTSGGHFHPAMTISFAIYQDFPWRKVPRYIFAQVLGAFLAGLVLMGTYHEQIATLTAGFKAEGLPLVMNGGPASILCPFPGATQNNLGYLFMIEFFVDCYVAFVIWASLDPANPFMSPTLAPFSIGLAFCTMIWGFAGITISTNTARDLGTRIVAAIFFGKEAFTYKNYSWIAILVNIPATIMMIGFYELVMRDSVNRIKAGHMQHEDGDEALERHLSRVETSQMSATNGDSSIGIGASLRKRMTRNSGNEKDSV